MINEEIIPINTNLDELSEKMDKIYRREANEYIVNIEEIHNHVKTSEYNSD